MKKAPCARLGMRIRPKISEKPDDNRNSRPPKATLFSVWMIQNCHCIDGPLPPEGTVGWVERLRETHLTLLRSERMGFARAQPILQVSTRIREIGEGAEASPAKRASPPPGAFRA